LPVCSYIKIATQITYPTKGLLIDLIWYIKGAAFIKTVISKIFIANSMKRQTVFITICIKLVFFLQYFIIEKSVVSMAGKLLIIK